MILTGFLSSGCSPRFLISEEDILPGFASEIKVIALLRPIVKSSSTVSIRADLFEHFKYGPNLPILIVMSSFKSGCLPKTFGKVASLNNACNESETFKKHADNHAKAFAIAKKLEGLNKNTGVHPSGISISFFDLEDIMPLQLTNDDSLISAYDMNDVASLTVKFDILGLRTLSVQVKGPGSGRETALRALQSRGFKILSIKDTTPMPHNGTRPPKKRRV